MTSLLLCLSCQDFFGTDAEGDRQEAGFSLGAFLTHPMFAVHSCVPLQNTGEGFAEHHLPLAELVPLSLNYFQGLFLPPQTYYILPIISKGTCFEGFG